MEIWKDIKNYEGVYQVSTKGNVRSWKYGRVRILKPSYNHFGYLSVSLCMFNKVKRFRTNRLVAEAFIENPNNYPVVNHIDGIKDNNDVENLEWCTRSYNDKHAFKLGIKTQWGENNSFSKLTEEKVLEIKKRLEMGEEGRKLAKEFGISESTVSSIKHGTRWGDIRSFGKTMADERIRTNIQRV